MQPIYIKLIIFGFIMGFLPIIPTIPHMNKIGHQRLDRIGDRRQRSKPA